MGKDNRLDQIVKICNQLGRVSIQELSEKLRVSEITIRRDIDLLNKLNLIKKIRGGAEAIVSKSADDFLHYNIEEELTKNIENKIRIGERAAQFVKSGEIVIFDSGSTLFYTAKSLPPKIPITAICYGLKIAGILSQKQITQLIVAGGIYHKDTDMFECMPESDPFKNIRAQKAFISAFGVHFQAGLTSGSFFASSIRKKILKLSEKVILLVDSSKFGKIEWAHFADLNEVDLIITDRGIPAEYKNFLDNIGVEYFLV